MAYSATVTFDRLTVSGRRHYRVTITESELAAASETALTDASANYLLPRIGRIAWVKATLTSGTGTTIDPKIGRASGWSADTQADIWANGSAAAHIAVTPNSPYTLAADEDLYWSSVPDSGTDNVTSIEIVIVEGLAPL